MKSQAVVTLSEMFYLVSEKASTTKGKNMLPLGASSFFLKSTPFSEQGWYEGMQTERQKSCFPCKIIAKNY